MVYESWATYVNRLFEDYSCGKHTCHERDSDKVEPQHTDQLPPRLERSLTWPFDGMRRGEEREKKVEVNVNSLVINICPQCPNMAQSVRIDSVCHPEPSLHFTAAAAGRAYGKRGHWGQTHTHQHISLSFPLTPSALKCLPTCPPTRFAATRCCSATHHPNHHIPLCCITLHLPDKWSTLSMFSRQILSLPLAVSQPSDLSVCLHILPLLNRMPSVLGKLQARRSGSRDLEGIGKTQLNGRSCLCLTLPT